MSKKVQKKSSKSVTKSASRATAGKVSKPSKKPIAAAGRIPAKTPAKMAPPSPAMKGVLAEGSRAPAFELPRDGGGRVSLAQFSRQKLVIFFYPRADTPGCTKEAIDFTRLSDAFAKAKTAVLGVSADPPKAQEAFRDKHRLSIPLGSDETHEMLKAYGVWGEKSMYGKTFLGIVRTTVLVGADGKVAKIWRNVKVDGHAEEVLSAVQAS